ncbi:4Fe-4S binding protein [Desulfovibrio sp. JY]|nr:4Fe-4S binding protein [Desulfovibrio sp. JY]
MSLRWLKPIRVAVALVFLVLTMGLFLDFRGVGVRRLADGVLYLQFVPSLLRFLGNAALGATGFLVVIALTLLFGRIYCSTFCPLGTLQDAIRRLSDARRRIAGKKRQRYAFSKPHAAIRYTVLALTVLLLLAGSGLLLNLLDPFSNFGRILANLAEPVVLAANNLAAFVAERWGIHAVYQVPWPAMAPVSVGVALAMLLTVGWLGARHGRLYCNTLCPVGTLLGMVSKHALFRLRIDPATCGACGRCERVCKAGCIDFREKTVDFSRCVGCCNCLAVCPDQALRFGRGQGKSPEAGTESPGRRRFLIGLAATGLGLAAPQTTPAQPAGFVQSRPTTIPEERTGPVSPPGSQSVAHFTFRCTACHLCVAACPSRVLVPSFLDYGPSGLMQPRLDFRSGYCNFDCTACSAICPSGAILPVAKALKQRTQLGVARFVKENCVVHTDNTNCGACSEHCPTKAVHMVPYLTMADRKLVIPEVNEAICVGCGACEHACPTRPYKAIYVRANPVHKQAEKPVEKALPPSPAMGEDFPF